jgi:hypothetical protein
MRRLPPKWRWRWHDYLLALHETMTGRALVALVVLAAIHLFMAWYYGFDWDWPLQRFTRS